MSNNTELLQKVKDIYGKQFFDDYSLSSVVIQRAQNNYIMIDISDLVKEMKSLQEEIEQKALRLVDEFTLKNYEYYNKL